MFAIIPTPLAAGAPPVGSIVHVVLVWLKDTGSAEHRQQVIDATRDFAQIPGVLEVRVGESVESERDIVDDSFDVGLYVTFASREDLRAYLVHERHQAAVRNVLQPLAERYIVYDFEDTAD